MQKCLKCKETKRLNKGICQDCRDKIIRPHYIAGEKAYKQEGKTNVK